MIFLDYSPFANTKNEYFKVLNETHRYEMARFQNAIFDEVHMIESADIVCSSDKKEWDYDTVFLWKCDTLEAGNIQLGGVPINQLLIRRRRKDEFTFENVKAIDFDPAVQFYEFKDKFIESYEDYVYGIQPMGGSVENPIMGETTTGEVESEFGSVWIVGKDTQYELRYDLNVGDYEPAIPTGVTDTLGNRYPFVSKNGIVNYRRGKVRFTIISDKTILGGQIHPKEEKELRRAMMAFLTDNKPKFLKEGSGESMLISIVNAPTLSPINELKRLLYATDIEFVEVGGIGMNSLANAGLVGGVAIDNQ